MNTVIGRLPTIPEYYKEYINSSVDLTMNPKQCCPFHKEDTPSFSYSAERKKWRCFGGCKCGGDVIDLHRKNYKLASRAEAEKSLKSLYKVRDVVELRKDNLNLSVSTDKIDEETIYQTALIKANTIDRWMELVYVMSKTPVDYMEIKHLLNKWEEIKK